MSATRVRRCWRSRTARSSPASPSGRPVAAGGDLVVNTSPDRLPGGLHRPLVRRPGRGDDLSADRQLRAAARRRPVGPAVAARAGRRARDGRGRRGGAPARDAAAHQRHPRDRRRRHARAGSPLGRTAACGAIAPARRDRPTRPSSRPRRAALGGPGLRRPGVAVGRARWATRRASRWSGSSTSDQGEHRRGLRRRGGRFGCCRTPQRSRRRSPATSAASCSRRDRAIRRGWPARSRCARAIIDDGRPLLGICLGHQIVGRAAGAETRRLRFGHHGANHPVQDLDIRLRPGDRAEPRGPGRRRVAPAGVGFRVSQLNLNDGSVEGLRHATKPIETVQYHPEGAPGPLDALAVFDRFVTACRRGA